MPFDFSKRNPPVTIKDRPCGYGKSTSIISNLSPDRSYLIVVPTLREVGRYLKDAPINLVEPVSTQEGGVHPRKRDHLRELLEGGHSIVTSHALFTDIAYLAKEGLLLSHDVIIDEVLDVVHNVTLEVETEEAKKQKVTMASWKGLYLDHGFAEVDPVTGKVTPTEEWIRKKDLPELSKTLFNIAMVDSLFAVGDNVLVYEMPPILLKAVGSLTVLTFLSEGSLMAAYMRRNGINFKHEVDHSEHLKFREDAKRLIEVRDMPAINRLRFSFSGQQTMRASDCKKVGMSLKNIRERLMRGIDKEEILITSAKNKWFTASGSPGPFAVGSRMFDGPNWIPNTTRGTNDFIECSQLVYLWDQNLNPRIAEFLGVDNQRTRDMYAVSELIQWVYRSRVRKGEPITLYMPSGRMRKLLQRWLDGDLELT